MQRVFVVRCLAAAAAIFLILSLAGCGGTAKVNTKVARIILNPPSASLNEGDVLTLSATAANSDNQVVTADITFSSSNSAIATVSTGGLVCAGVWDTNIINCNATLGQGGVGQVTITATSGDVTATSTIYVHEHVDIVQAVVTGSCASMGQAINVAGKAFSTTAPGCSTTNPCDITSSVGPFTFGATDSLIAASSAGVDSTFDSTHNTPTYVSGGTFTGSKGDTCNLSNFNGVTGAMGTLALTGTNTVAGGTQLTITATGYGGTTPPTIATLSNGTATCSGNVQIQTRLTNGVLTAENPGATSVFASVAGVNSVGVSYETCRVAGIKVKGTETGETSFTLNPGDAKSLTADLVDSMGQTVVTNVNWGSTSPAAASVAPLTSVGPNAGAVTAHVGGTAFISAICSDPCNRGLPAYYSQNVVTITVTSPAATTVYAANTNSTQLVPINTSTNAAGTAITLPAVPNSIMADALGQNVYLGSSRVLMGVNVSTGAVTSYAVPGKVVAITNDGNYVLVSDPNSNTTFYVHVAAGMLASQTPGTASAGAFTPDNLFSEWVGGTQFAFGPQTGLTGSVTLGNPADSMDLSSQGGLAYITSAMGHQVLVYSTCDQMQTQALSAPSPTLVRALPNAAGAVAVDPPNLDVISTPTTLDPGCTVPTQSTIAGYDLQAGSFTPQQLLVSSDATRAWIVTTDLMQLLTLDLTAHTPTSVPLTGGATALNAGITLNGGSVYVGASDGTVHRIEAASLADAVQIQVNLKDTNNNPVPPNLVAVVP